LCACAAFSRNEVKAMEEEEKKAQSEKKEKEGKNKVELGSNGTRKKMRKNTLGDAADMDTEDGNSSDDQERKI
jgi:hypothetical protein